MFPWANIEDDIDEDKLHDDLINEFMAEWSYKDYMYVDWNYFEEWKKHKIDSMPKIKPYENVSNEVDLYKLNLTLNDLGESFLELNKYFNSFDEFIC